MHKNRMIVIGLTGSMGMGKSFVAEIFREFGIEVFDADKVVSKSFNKQSVINRIKKLIPEVVLDNKINNKKLSDIAMKNNSILLAIEKIIHPLVLKEKDLFIQKSLAAGRKIIILEIPLLFETGYDKFCHKIIVVDCSFETQKKRVLNRANMNIEKFNNILKKQIPNQEKLKKADYIINTDEDRVSIKNKINKIIVEVVNERNSS